GTNRKLLVFDMEELPVMARGRGVILQRFRDAYLSDVTVLRLEDGLSWPTGSRTRHERDLTAWRGKRASAGRMAPQGFPRSHKFEEPGES
ncbi:MAG: DNA topoisomerase IV subunit A, partial [Geminicoccaceae bacterium]|nr:DNA topoisomerase IV subunit A [Geminicoccaceae bacterium]